MRTANSLEKTLMLGKIEGWRTRGWQKTRWLDGIIESMYMSLNKLSKVVKDSPGVLQSMGLQRVRHDLATEQQQRYIQKSVYLTYFCKLSFRLYLWKCLELLFNDKKLKYQLTFGICKSCHLLLRTEGAESWLSSQVSGYAPSLVVLRTLTGKPQKVGTGRVASTI